MLAWFRRLIRNIDQVVWLGIFIIVAVVAVVTLLLRTSSATNIQEVNLTIDAAATQANLFVPTLAANLTLTPVEAALTGAAPTLALSGKQQVQQYAASALASSERDPLAQGAIQAGTARDGAGV